MKKSKALFGVSTNDMIEQIKIDSSNKTKNVMVESNAQKTKTLLKQSKVIRGNTRKK